MGVFELDDALAVALLDGRVPPEVQARVDQARTRLTLLAADPTLDFRLAGFVVDAVAEAVSSGKLAWSRCAIGYCRLCGRSGGHVKYKGGPNRGLPNLAKPIRLAGVEMAVRSVTVAGSAALGGCRECVERTRPILVGLLADVRAEVPDQLGSPGRPRWRRERLRRCTCCGWTGVEGLMGRRRTAFGDGRYPAECPGCDAVNVPFGKVLIGDGDGFEVVEAGVWPEMEVV